MSRLAFLAPVALLTTACAVRTPATALDVGAADPALAQSMDLPAEGDVIGAWQLPTSNRWSRYEKLTLLSYLADTPVVARMPDVRQLNAVHSAEVAAARLGAVGVPLDTMWVVDLRGAASVAFGAMLSQASRTPVAPVLTFNNWPADNEVVPAEQTLAALVTMHPRSLPAGEFPTAPIFLLDAWRLAMRTAEPDPAAIDNRYVLLASDFPDAAVLRARGIRRVVYVVEDRGRTSTEEDDFNEVALGYQDAGIPVSLVDLRQLSRIGDIPPERYAEQWQDYLDDWALGVRRRSTVFDDPRFYERARAGFGGVRAAPAGREYRGAAPSERGHLIGPPAGGHGGRAYSGASPHVGGVGGG
jgi:hypothetical protein